MNANIFYNYWVYSEIKIYKKLIEKVINALIFINCS